VYDNSADPAAVLNVNRDIISQRMLNSVSVHVGGITVLSFHDIDYIAGDKPYDEKNDQTDKNNGRND
jgi:hypothetical protein